MCVVERGAVGFRRCNERLLGAGLQDSQAENVAEQFEEVPQGLSD